MAKETTETKWLGRKNKSRQDTQNVDYRERVQEWDKRIAWMRTHKPRRSSDWVAYNGH